MNKLSNQCLIFYRMNDVKIRPCYKTSKEHIKRCYWVFAADVLGRHFKDHGKDLDLKNENVFEQNIMKHFELTITGSVEPNNN